MGTISSAPMRGLMPIESSPSSRLELSETWIGRPLSVAPCPTRPTKISSRAGAATKPISSTPWCAKPMETHQEESSLRNGCVPSMGSTIQRSSASASLCPNSSPKKASSGKRSSMAARMSCSTSVSASETTSCVPFVRTVSDPWLSK